MLERRRRKVQRKKRLRTRRQRRRPSRAFGDAGRYVASGPPTWRRTYHTSKGPAIDQAKACSKKHPNAVCKVTEGLPGMQRTVVECNRNECYAVGGGVGKRRRRKARR